MEEYKVRRRNAPEAKIQEQLIVFLQGKGWFVKPTHGSMFQSGFPDLYCCHFRLGPRWVEVKNPERYNFTNAQREFFPKFSAANSGIWILTAATEEEYKKLSDPPNWHLFIKGIYDVR